MYIYIKISVSLRVSELNESHETLPETITDVNTNNSHLSDGTVGYHFEMIVFLRSYCLSLASFDSFPSSFIDLICSSFYIFRVLIVRAVCVLIQHHEIPFVRHSIIFALSSSYHKFFSLSFFF